MPGTLTRPSSPRDANEEISELIATLHATDQRLEELTAGEVDSVADQDGRTFLLQRAQGRLRLGEAAKQSAILDALPAHIALLDAQGAIISVNEAWREFARENALQSPGYGVDLDYLKTCDGTRGADSVEARAAAKGMRSVLSGESKIFSLEYACHSAAERRWFLMTVTPLHDGRANGAVVMHLNITERKLAEKALRASEKEFRTLAESMPQIVWVSRPDGWNTYFNQQWTDYTGLTLEESLGHGWSKPFHPDDQARARDAWQRATQTTGIYSIESRLRRADGIYRWWLIRGIPLRDAAGAIVKWFGTCTDIHDLKVAELEVSHTNRELRQSETRVTRLNRVYSVLSGINALIVRVRDRGELFREACRMAIEAGGFRMAWIGIVDKEAGVVKPVATAGDVRDYFEAAPLAITDAKPGGHGLTGRAIREMKPVISNDAHNDPQRMMKRQLLERGINSLAIIPLLVGGEAIGVLALYSTEVGFFDDEEMKLLLELAGDIAFAIDHIEAAAKLGRMTRVNAMLSGINSAIVRIRERRELFEEACRIAVEEGGLAMAWIGIVDRAAQKIVPVASAGANAGFLADPRRWLSLIDDSPGPSVIAVRDRQPVVVDEVDSDPRMQGRRAHLDPGVRSLVILPLLVAGEPVAVFGLHAIEPGYFDEKEMTLLRELGANVAFAVDHIDKQERLDYLAYYDPLTGLANRGLFLERVAQFMRGAAGEGHQLALFLFDLERFKSINDSLGRAAGDALLQQVAQWLTRNLGDANLFARVDADHFAIVLPQVKQQGDVARLVEKSMAALLEHPFQLNDAVFRITAKVGVALFPQDGADADTLFKNAEAALKKAKARGDRYLFFTQKMTETVAGKLTLENQLRRALDQEEYVLHYQPKVSLVSGKLTGVEALIRWNDPATGLVPPGKFIPILEETGLIYDVGRWALRKAISDHLRWISAGLPAMRIAVNVSPLQLRNRGFVDEIRQAIGIDAPAPAGLELEITESLIMEDVKHNIASLQAIRALGVSIAIDDFGTGFSSLSYLAKLPVDTLKIDRSFVIELTAGPEGLALVSTIISLAHSLKLKVVAEGVETEEQSRVLRLLSCDEMQGFLFSKPVPSEVLETRFLAASASV